jgi:hypothetical protein
MGVSVALKSPENVGDFIPEGKPSTKKEINLEVKKFQNPHQPRKRLTLKLKNFKIPINNCCGNFYDLSASLPMADMYLYMNTVDTQINVRV